MLRSGKWLVFTVLLCAGCRIPDYDEIRNLYRVTRYLSAARLDKEFEYRGQQAIASADPKYSPAAKERWAALQNAVWDFSSLHQSFHEVTLEHSEGEIWEKPFAFFDSKPGKKLTRSLDIYYEQAAQLSRDYKEKEVSGERRRLLTELYFLDFDLGLEEDIARLLNPLFTEAIYKVKMGRAPDSEDEDFKERSAGNLRRELRRLRRLEQAQKISAGDLRDLSLRLSLMSDDDLALIVRELSRPENTDMARLERIAIAESVAFQIEDFLAVQTPAKPGEVSLPKE